MNVADSVFRLHYFAKGANIDLGSDDSLVVSLTQFNNGERKEHIFKHTLYLVETAGLPSARAVVV